MNSPIEGERFWKFELSRTPRRYGLLRPPRAPKMRLADFDLVIEIDDPVIENRESPIGEEAASIADPAHQPGLAEAWGRLRAGCRSAAGYPSLSKD